MLPVSTKIHPFVNIFAHNSQVNVVGALPVLQQNARARWSDATELEERTDSRDAPQIFFPQFPQWAHNSLPGELKRHDEQRRFGKTGTTRRYIKQARFIRRHRDSTSVSHIHEPISL